MKILDSIMPLPSDLVGNQDRLFCLDNSIYYSDYRQITNGVNDHSLGSVDDSGWEGDGDILTEAGCILEINHYRVGHFFWNTFRLGE